MKKPFIKAERSGWIVGLKCPKCRRNVVFITALSRHTFGVCGCAKVLWDHCKGKIWRKEAVDTIRKGIEKL